MNKSAVYHKLNHYEGGTAMKVIAINGSPKKEGNTYHAIRLVAEELSREGIDTEIIHVGGQNHSGVSGLRILLPGEKPDLRHQGR